MLLLQRNKKPNKEGYKKATNQEYQISFYDNVKEYVVLNDDLEIDYKVEEFANTETKKFEEVKTEKIYSQNQVNHLRRNDPIGVRIFTPKEIKDIKQMEKAKLQELADAEKRGYEKALKELEKQSKKEGN